MSMSSKSISSLDLYKLIGELSFIDNGFIRNVKSEKNALFLLIYSGEERWLKIVPGRYLAITREKPADTIEFPLTSKIKSEMKGKRIHVSMHGADRIIEIGNENIKLVIELFSNGNVILVKDGMIEQAMFNRDYVTRVVATGERFVYPKANLDVFNMDFHSFSETLRKSDKSSLVKSLAIDLSIGGLYAEEIAYRADIDKDMKPKLADESALEKIHGAFKSILAETPLPNIIDGKFFAVVELKHLGGSRIYFSSISEALEKFFEEKEVPQKQKPAENKFLDIEKAVTEYSAKADFLQENFQYISKLISLIRDSKKPLIEREAELKRESWALDGRFIYRLSDNGLRIDITKPLRDTISEYYNKIKKLKRSLNKVIELKESPKRLKFKTLSAWYSKFRWSLTSEGNLVVFGRDNSQNMALISKYVEKNDLVLHADVFGSPFGVIKPNKDQKISETALKEAASIIASYSSAWKSGAGSLDVYWVKPEQVTKSPPSGESLKKGAFYIEGKREYIQNAPMEVYLDIVFDNQEYTINAMPYKPKENFVLIRPGNKKRDEAITKIIKTFSDRARIVLERDKLDRLIPQGRLSIEKINIAQNGLLSTKKV